MDNELVEIREGGVSVVIPCFNSTKALFEVVRQLEIAFIEQNIVKFEIILVIDDPGEPAILFAKEIQREIPTVVIIELSKNYGQHAAIFAGLALCKNDFIVTMDDDGQHPGSEVISLLRKFDNETDVVYGIAINGEHKLLRNLTSRWAKYVTYKLLNIKNARNISAFRAFRRFTVMNLEFQYMTNAVVDVVLNWSTDKFTVAEIEMRKRQEGKSNYSYRKLARFTVQMITGYSIRPLRIATIIGFVTFLISFGISMVLIIQEIMGNITVPGYASVSLFILIIGSTQLLTIGIIGEYLGRVHENSMRKPLYSVKKIHE